MNFNMSICIITITINIYFSFYLFKPTSLSYIIILVIIYIIVTTRIIIYYFFITLAFINRYIVLLCFKLLLFVLFEKFNKYLLK